MKKAQIHVTKFDNILNKNDLSKPVSLHAKGKRNKIKMGKFWKINYSTVLPTNCYCKMHFNNIKGKNCLYL